MKREAHAVPAGSAMGVCHAAGVLNLSGQGVVPGMLSGLVGLPLLAMVGVWCCPAAWVRRVAVGGGIATLLWTGLVLAQFDVHTAAWQMGEQVPWLGMLGLNYGLAVDGVSLPLLGLSSLVLLLVLASKLLPAKAGSFQ